MILRLSEFSGRTTSVVAVLSRFQRTLHVAWRNLQRQLRLSLIATSSVAFGVLFLILASGFMESMFLEFREAIIQSQYGHMQVTRPKYHSHGHADPNAFVIADESELRAAVRSLELRALSPRIDLSGLISKDESTIAFIAQGIDPEKDMVDDRALKIVEGSRESMRNARTVLLGAGLARLLGARAGDTVVLLVNTPGGGSNAMESKVGGVFSSVNTAFDETALLMNVTDARKLSKVAGAHRWMIYLRDTAGTTDAARQLSELLPGSEFEVKRWDELAEFYNRAVALLRDQLGVVRIIVVVIIMLGIGNTMMMSAMERTGEMGTTMALGYRRNTLLTQLVCEGAIIGLAGGVLGLVLGYLLSVGISALNIEMPPAPGLTRGYTANVLITPVLAIEAAFLAFFTTTIASLYPAWKVSRMPIIDALRHNR